MGSSDYVLWIVYINVALYATCFQIQRPLEPFLVDKLLKDGDSAAEYARLQSFFSLVQTFGALISGRLLDKFGAKGGFLVNFAACALCYGLLSQSTTIGILYASKIPTIFQMGFMCAQLSASQLTSDGPERVKALGRLTMSYTVGAVLGPTIGGFLGASGDYYFGAKIAVVGSILSLILTLFMPNDHKPIAKKENEDSSKSKSSGDFEIPSYMTVIKLVWLFLSTKVITSVANAMATTVFPLVLKNNFDMNEKGLGVTMSISSAFNTVVSGLFIEPIVKYLGGDLCQVILNCLIGMTLLSGLQGLLVSDAVASLTPGRGLYQFIGVGYLISILQYILATTITSESTTRVGHNAKGTLLGLEHALFAAARVAAPQGGIMLLQSNGISSVCFVCAAIFALVTFLWGQYSASFTVLEKLPTKAERKEK